MIIQEAKKELPSLKKVWLLSTSFGTVTSSHIPKERFSEFSGIVHTSTINNTSKYSTQYDVKYADITIPQLFVHHAHDLCSNSRYEGLLDIAQKAKIPLYTIASEKKRADEKISVDPCNAFSPHGFKGVEAQVMQLIRKAILEGIQPSGIFEF
jgi:alpha/beta superfamily hydrolase